MEAALREAGARENAGVVVGKKVRDAMEKTIREVLDVHQDGKVVKSIITIMININLLPG